MKNVWWKVLIGVGLVAAAIAAVVTLVPETALEEPGAAGSSVKRIADGGAKVVSKRKADFDERRRGAAEDPDAAVVAGDGAGDIAEAEEPAEELSEADRDEREAERRVEAFNGAVDRWMDAEKTRPPTVKEIGEFHALFERLPKKEKADCLQRALNLIPDQNVMLLAGVLMDKAEEKELVRMVYDDVLNRDEEVKKPILQEIFQDRDHSCWADTAWILDATGQLPRAGVSPADPPVVEQ